MNENTIMNLTATQIELNNNIVFTNKIYGKMIYIAVEGGYNLFVE
jgi:hypothetical protein